MNPDFDTSPLQVHRLVSDLRQCGVNVALERAILMLQALQLYKSPSLEEIYWLGRATLCCNRDEFGAYERCFLALFNDARPSPLEREPEVVGQYGRLDRDTKEGGKSAEADRDPDSATADGWSLEALTPDKEREGPDTQENNKTDPVIGGAGASDVDAVRSKDFVLLTSAERSEVLAMINALSSSGPLRRSRRQASSTSGTIDVRRTVANAFSHAGDPERLFRQSRTFRFRRCIVLVDVSGSMARYAELLLRMGYGLTQSHPRTTELFTIGTHLTRVTRFLQIRDPDRALTLATSAVPDWQGGTRLGDQIKAFLDCWGQRGMARGALVLIASDGWERGDCSVLADQMKRLRRLAFRIVWCNPHKSTSGYEPTARGIRAVLPYVDDFVAGASMNDMQAVISIVTRGCGRGRECPASAGAGFDRRAS